MSQFDLSQLRDDLRAFALARDWQSFHTPKNLVMALSVEVAELLEHFQWLEPAQSRDLPARTRDEVAQEIADVLIYLTRLADVLGIDPLQSAFAKMQRNAEKYPIERCRGRADKPSKAQ